MNTADEELAVLYVLDQLEARERADFEARLRVEPGLAQTVRELEAALAGRVRALPAAAVPAGVLTRLEKGLDGGAETRGPVLRPLAGGATHTERTATAVGGSWRRWGLLGGLAAAFFIAFGYLLSERLHQGGAKDSFPIMIAVLDPRGSALTHIPMKTEAGGADARFVQLAELAEQLWNDPGKLPVRAGRATEGGKGYTVFDPATRQGFIGVQQVPNARQGQRYRLWMVDPKTGAPRDAGALPLVAANRGLFFFTVPEAARGQSDVRFFVTVEDESASAPSAPSGKVVLGDRSF